MTLVEAILTFLLQSPGLQPGNTAFSVEPAPGAKYSSHYGTTVKRETYETGAKRYRATVTALVEATDEVLKETGSTTFTRAELASLATGVMVQEGGLREDVQSGRGWAKKADDVGGRGRGPGKEGCSAQIHPLVAWRFVDRDTDPELLNRAKRGEWKAQLAVVETLIGRDHAALKRCFRTQMRMLVHNAKWCSGRNRRAPDWKAVSVYVTGTSCDADPYRKTTLRVNLARRIHAFVKAGGKASKPISSRSPTPCTGVPFTPIPGYVAVAKRTQEMAAWARSLHALQLPLHTTRERRFGSSVVLARVDMHCDEVRGPHRGVSLYKPEVRQ